MLYENTANPWYRMSEVQEASGACAVFTEYDRSPENYGNEESLCFHIARNNYVNNYWNVFWHLLGIIVKPQKVKN